MTELTPEQHFQAAYDALVQRVQRLTAKVADDEKQLAADRAQLAEAQGTLDRVNAAIAAYLESQNPKPSSPAAPPVGPFTVQDDKFAKDYGFYYAGTAGGITLEKKDLRNHRRDNVRCMAWDSSKGAQPVAQPITVRDLILSGASAATPKALDGTAESNLWAGMTGEYRRIKGSKAAWMGLWTGGHSADPRGGCTNSVFEDGEWSDTYVGIYVELVTRYTEFRRQWVHDCYGPALKIEWAQVTGPARTRLVTHDLLFDDCTFDVRAKRDTGYWRDVCDIDIQSGCYGVTIQNSTIITGGRKPLINFPRALDDPSKPNRLINCKDEFGNLLEPTYEVFP